MSDIQEVVEPLEKKCPRCGKPSANKSNPSGRCSACLKKLATAKKTPGHWQRAQTKADDALRRQKGKNGTAHKKSSGLGTRASIVKQTQSAEKRTGQKLSPDRKNNGRGYAASNTRMVPEKLNRGRHHVDPKKLAAWRKRLKKSELDADQFYTLLKARAIETQDQEMLDLIKAIHEDFSAIESSGLANKFLDIFDEVQELKKEAALKAPEQQPHPLDQHIGKTHTVEIHPDMDLMYRAKGLIKENNRPHLSIQHFKKAGFPEDIIKKLPRDVNGKVTPEMIDKHIAGLPKHKVDVELQPYTWGSQQHRKGPQYVAKMHLHKDTLNNMSSEHKDLWNLISGKQHKFDNHNSNQFGWTRIDAHSKPDHWHLDEIQSDFQNKDKITEKLRTGTYNPHFNTDEGDEERIARLNEQKIRASSPNTINEHLQHLSHGHQDPQHAIHSAVNALGRKLGIKSISMDTPKDQAEQSGLHVRDRDDDDRRNYERYESDMHNFIHHNLKKEHFDSDAESHDNPNLRTAFNKIGHKSFQKALLSASSGSEPSEQIFNNLSEEDNKKLSNPEKHAIQEYVVNFLSNGPDLDGGDYHLEPYQEEEQPEEKFDMSKLPVHQIDTYHKRPKRLGMKEVPKNNILGEYPDDKADNVQYMNLHKKMQHILVELKKANQLPIDKSKFKYKHAKTDDTHSHYDVHHDGRLVGQIAIDRKTKAPSGGYVQPAFHHLLDHISNSVKAFHIARNTNTDN